MRDSVPSDHFVPPGTEVAAGTEPGGDRAGVSSARWSGETLAALMHRLTERGAAALRRLDAERLVTAWHRAVAIWRHPDSAARRDLDPYLARACRLSGPGLAAALEAVLGGVDGEDAHRALRSAVPCADGRPAVVVLAGNLPALCVQSLLPALAVRRPVLLKSPSVEPLFAPAFLRTLAELEPALGEALAACTWPGGDRGLESPVLERAGRVIAYGEAETLRDLESRCGDRLVAYGPKISLAALGAEVSPAEVAEPLARDIALFDQRGCLSVHAIYTEGDPEELARAVSRALGELASSWGPGTPSAAERAAVRLAREEARWRELSLHELELAAGTVIVEARTELAPSPGLRLVRIHPLDRLEQLPAVLRDWEGRLQGVALAGAPAGLDPALEGLGVSRVAAPGRLQSPDALWHNGGISPLAALGS